MLLDNLLDKTRWLAKRDAALREARLCQTTLTNPNGYWKYAAEDARVTAAVSFWIVRARHAHDVAMGRRPVIANAIIIDNAGSASGSLWAA